MCQFVNVLDVEVLPPHVPSAAEQADPALYAANVREEYRTASGLPLVEQSQTEFIALCKVQNSRKPQQNVWKKPAKTCQKLCAAKRA